jgi:PAS domain S-box-containing protein
MLLFAPEVHSHIVQFYKDEGLLSRVVADFLAAGLEAGEPLVVIATEAHREAFRRQLTERGYDVERAIASGQFVLFDAAETLKTFMASGMPEWEPFRHHVGGTLEKLGAPFPGKRIRAYGEMVDLLWKEGQRSAAIRLEELWNDLGKLHPFSLLCAYVMGNFYRDGDSEHFQHVCDTHSHVLPAETYVDTEDPAERLRQISLLQQHALALETELQDRKQLEQALRVALEERRRAEEEVRHGRQELQDFVENAAEGLHWVGSDGRIQWANQFEWDLLGYSKDDYIGKHISEFHADPEVIQDILARLGRNETLHGYEARLKARDGSIKHVLINSNVYRRDGEFIHTRCFTRDITDRKRAEEESRLRSEFQELLVGVVSHDLRNPIAAITMSSALARARTTDERLAKVLARITASADRASRIIADLLDLTQARLGGGIPIHAHRTSLRKIAEEVVEEHRASHPEREIVIEHEGDASGEWDSDRLAQAFSNLVSNAIHYSPPHSPIRVRTRADSRDVAFSVHNDGPPIPEELQSRIFEPFKRGSTDRKTKNLGLGLYIVERIVASHGGQVDCRSTATEGTTFTVVLPPRAAG